MPIKMEELLQLGSKGIQPADINHTSVRMESDKYITIRQASGNLTMIDMSNAGGEPERIKTRSQCMRTTGKCCENTTAHVAKCPGSYSNHCHLTSG